MSEMQDHTLVAFIGFVISAAVAIYMAWEWERSMREASKWRLEAKLAKIKQEYAEDCQKRAEEHAEFADRQREFSKKQADIAMALLYPDSVTIEIHSNENEKPN